MFQYVFYMLDKTREILSLLWIVYSCAEGKSATQSMSSMLSHGLYIQFYSVHEMPMLADSEAVLLQ